jgi:hypothetical protein
MTTYSDLNKLMIVHDEKYEKWENDLFNEAVSLHEILVKKLNPPVEEIQEMTIIDGKISDVEKQRIVIEKPHENYNEDEYMLLNRANFRSFINDAGSLLFSIIFNFPGTKSGVILSKRIFLTVRYNNNQPVFAMLHRVTLENCDDFISKEEMVDKIIENFLKISSIDFYQGKEKSQIGFGF